MLKLFKSLRLFGEGGDGGGGAAPGGPAGAQGGADPGVTVPAAGEQPIPKRKGRDPSKLSFEVGQPEAQPPQAQAPTQEAPKEESFQELIKGKYKKEYGEAVQGVIRERFKNQQDAEARAKDAEAMLAQFAAQKYGIQPGEDGRLDLKNLRSVMQNDDEFYEAKAAELGTSTEFARKYSDMERQLEQYHAQEVERQNYMAYQQVKAQAEEAKKIFPGLDLNTEMGNPDFARLIRNNVPVETAYRVIHANEITAQQTAYAAQQAKAAAAASIQAGMNRPIENGLGRQAAATTDRVTDPRALTRAQRKELREYINRGGKVAWG